MYNEHHFWPQSFWVHYIASLSLYLIPSSNNCFIKCVVFPLSILLFFNHKFVVTFNYFVFTQLLVIKVMETSAPLKDPWCPPVEGAILLSSIYFYYHIYYKGLLKIFSRFFIQFRNKVWNRSCFQHWITTSCCGILRFFCR
jgi:hypothetical protein